MTKATTYNWDYLPEKYEKPGEFKPYKIKGDIIQALKSNRDIELESYKRRLTEGLNNMDLEAKEQEMNIRAVNNVKKINEDRDLAELQMMTEAGKQLVLFGMKEWNKSQVRAGGRRWDELPPEKKAEYMKNYRAARSAYLENETNHKNFETFLKETDNAAFQSVRDLLEGLGGPGISELQRRMIISARPGVQAKRADLLYNYEIDDPLNKGEKIGIEDLRLRKDDQSKALAAELETRAYYETIDFYRFIGGVQVADNAVIEEQIVPELLAAQRAESLQTASDLRDQAEEDAKIENQERVRALVLGLNQSRTAEGVAINEENHKQLMGYLIAQQPSHLSLKEKTSLANDQLTLILKDMVDKEDWKHFGRHVDRWISSKTKNGDPTWKRQLERFSRLGLIQSIETKKKAGMLAKNNQESVDTFSATQELLGRAEGLPEKRFKTREDMATAVSEIASRYIGTKIPKGKAVAFMQAMWTAGDNLVLDEQNLTEKYIDLTTGPLLDQTISYREATLRNFSPDLIKMLEESGHVVKDLGEFTPQQIKQHPQDIYNGVTKRMKAAGPERNLSESFTVTAIREAINAERDKLMTEKNISFGQAHKLAVLKVREDAMKEAAMDSETLRKEGRLLYQRPPSLQPNIAGQKTVLAIKGIRKTNSSATLNELIKDNAFTHLDPYLTQVQKAIINEMDVDSLRTLIRNNAAFSSAASEVGGNVFSADLVDKLLKNRTKTKDQKGVGLPGDFYTKEEVARHWSYLNEPKPTAGSRVCAAKQTMLLPRQKAFLNQRTRYTDDKIASSFHLKRAGEVSNKRISDNFNPDVLDKTVISEKLKENGLQTVGFGTYSGEFIFEGLGAALAAIGLPLNDIREISKHKIKQEHRVKGYDGRPTIRAVQVSRDSPLIDYIDQYGDLYGLSIIDRNKPYRTIIYNGPTTPYDPTLKTLIKSNNCGINIDTKVDARVINAALQNVQQTHGAFPFLHDGKPIWDLPEEQRHILLQEALEDRIIKDRQPVNTVTHSYRRFNLKPQSVYPFNLGTDMMTGWEQTPLGGFTQ